MTDASGTWFVTPTLMVGARPNLSRVVEVATVEAAIAVVHRHDRALLPDWELVDSVLAALGLEESERRRRIHFARTGEFPRQPSP
jgi:hypothetical protein